MPLYVFRCNDCLCGREQLAAMGTTALPCPRCGGIATRTGVNRPSVITFRDWRPMCPNGRPAPPVDEKKDRQLRHVNQDRPAVYEALRRDSVRY